MRWGRTLLVGLACVSLAGCIIIPFPVDKTKGRAVDVDPKTAFQTGVTTREEVLTRLGQPDHDTIDRGHVFVYSWWHAGWGFAAFSGFNGNVGTGASYRIDYLAIKFDESDRIVDAERGDTYTYFKPIKLFDASYYVFPLEPKPDWGFRFFGSEWSPTRAEVATYPIAVMGASHSTVAPAPQRCAPAGLGACRSASASIRSSAKASRGAFSVRTSAS